MPRRQLATVVRSMSVVGPVSRALSNRPSPSSPDDDFYFDRFRCSTVPNTVVLFPSQFWQQTTMQMAHSEPAIWHAAVAMGMLHQHMESLVVYGTEDNALLEKASTHFSRAQGFSVDLDSPSKALTVMVLLVAASNLLERWPVMQQYLMDALAKATQLDRQGAGNPGLPGFMAKLELQAMTHSESSSPFPYAKSASLLPAASLLTGPIPSETTYEGLSGELFGMFRALLVLDNNDIQTYDTYGPWLTMLETFTRRLASWEARVAVYEGARGSRPQDQSKVLSLRLYHALLRTMEKAGLSGPETRYDSQLGTFDYVVNLASCLVNQVQGHDAFSLSMEPGIVIPLWLVIHRCRHPVVRRRALRLLSHNARVEGMWRSGAVSKALGAVVETEEGIESVGSLDPYESLIDVTSLPPVSWDAWQLPGFTVPTALSWNTTPVIMAQMRVKDILATTDYGRGSVYLSLMMTHPTDFNSYGEARPLTIRV